MSKHRPMDHWVCIPEEDLLLIERGPRSYDTDVVAQWVRDVQDIIEDGLETA